jgi:hypothetical protein
MSSEGLVGRARTLHYVPEGANDLVGKSPEEFAAGSEYVGRPHRSRGGGHYWDLTVSYSVPSSPTPDVA